jgi:CRISPR-associated protein Cmr4
MSNPRIYWLHALSPTHVGNGRGVGYIDLPIDRDVVTGWPIIRGWGFQGAWADFHRATKEARETGTPEGRLLEAAFGVDAAGDDNNSNSGALIPTDAHLVCLPVRSFRGTFAWCTSPLCLQMLRRSLELAGVKDLPQAPPALADDVAHHGTDTVLKEGEQLFLEDLDLQAKECPTAAAWAEWLAIRVFPGDSTWQEQFKKRFAVLSDTAFDFLCETGTEVQTRVRIDDDTRTVAAGSHWTEESLPAETILAGIVQCDRLFGPNGEDITPAGLLDRFASEPLILQIGGKATVGRGQMRCVFMDVKGGGQ